MPGNPLSPSGARARAPVGDSDGREARFEALFRTHYGGLLRFARVYVREREQAEDLVHDVFLRVWEQHADSSGAAVTTAYLYGAVRNCAIDFLRHQAVARRYELGGFAGDGESRGHVVAEDGQEHDGFAEAEMDRAIQVAIDGLPTRCRQAFLLHRRGGMTYAEVAAVMQTSPATVKAQMGRALKALRVALAPLLPEG